MGLISGLLVYYITCTIHALAIHNKFLAPLPVSDKSLVLCQQLNKFLVSFLGKVQFGIWIDILEKEKFANLRKKYFFSYFLLFLICI